MIIVCFPMAFSDIIMITTNYAQKSSCLNLTGEVLKMFYQQLKSQQILLTGDHENVPSAVTE
jgi:hypothetical protein